MTRTKKGWVADKGAYKILVGSSSRDLLLNGKFETGGNDSEIKIRCWRETVGDPFEALVVSANPRGEGPGRGL